MIRFKSPINLAIVLLTLVGLVVFIGCGNSKEEQTMVDFLKLYSDTVDEYAAADNVKKAELKAKLDTFASKWMDMEREMDGRLTPNDLEKYDKQYKEIDKQIYFIDWQIVDLRSVDLGRRLGLLRNNRKEDGQPQDMGVGFFILKSENRLKYLQSVLPDQIPDTNVLLSC
jgi:hypothetical protein